MSRPIREMIWQQLIELIKYVNIILA
nr:hypothetical protein [Gilliamella apicola]